MTKIGLCVIAGLTIGGIAAADAPPPAAMAMPKPSADLDALKPMLRSWSCTGTNPAGEKGAATDTFKKDLDGFWITERIEIKKTKSFPGFTGFAVFGKDPVKGDWVTEGWDNYGGTLHVRSKDGMTWTGTSVDQGKEAPATLTTSMDAKTKHMMFSATVGGQKIFDYDCK